MRSHRSTAFSKTYGNANIYVKNDSEASDMCVVLRSSANGFTKLDTFSPFVCKNRTACTEHRNEKLYTNEDSIFTIVGATILLLPSNLITGTGSKVSEGAGGKQTMTLWYALFILGFD